MPPMRSAVIEIAGEKRTIGLAHTKMDYGGGWSYFVCPSCLRLARTIRMLGDRLVCRSCDGLLAHCQMRDKGPAIARREERLKTAKHRQRLTAISLRRAKLIERRAKFKGWPPNPN